MLCFEEFKRLTFERESAFVLIFENLAAEDARWMHSLLTPRLANAYVSRSERLGITPNILAKSKELFTKAMKGDKQITRTALYEILEDAGIPTKNSLGLHIIGRLAHDGLLCFGPRKDKQPTFALFDEWVPTAAKGGPKTREECLKELAIRYFTSHGPAQIQDLNWWSGLTTKDIRQGIEMALRQAQGKPAKLRKEEVEGKIYYMAPSQPSIKDSGEAHLLPPFDEFLVAYKDRDASLEKMHAQHINPGANGMLSPIIVINGQVIGTWRRKITKSGIAVTYQPFRKSDRRGKGFTAAEKNAIEWAILKYKAFMAA